MPLAGKGAQLISMTIRNLQSLENDDDVLVGCTYLLNSTKKPVRITVTATGKPYHEVIVDTTGQRMLVKFEHLYIDKTLAPTVG